MMFCSPAKRVNINSIVSWPVGPLSAPLTLENFGLSSPRRQLAMINRGRLQRRCRGKHQPEYRMPQRETSLMTQRVYSMQLEIVRDRIKLAGVPTFPMSKSRLRTRELTDIT